MLLDTFMIMFDADASDLNKGLEESEKKSKKVTSEVGKADQASKNLGKSFGNLLATAGGALAAAFSAGAIFNGINKAADYADELGKLSDSLDISIGDIESWSNAVVHAGGSGDGFKNTLQFLTSELQSIATTGTAGTFPFFQRLGVSLRDTDGHMRSVMGILPELADKFSQMSKQESIGFGKKLGLDQGTIMLLQQGRNAVEEQIRKQKELGTTTEEQAKISAEYNDSITDMQFAFRGLFLSVGQSVIPAFKWVAEVVTDAVEFMKKHSDFVTGLFIALGVAAAVFLIPPLYAVAAAAIVAFAPFLLAGAIVAGLSAAFALLYDDIQNFLSGNESMIGDISKDYPLVGEIVLKIVDAFKILFDVVTFVLSSLAQGILHPIETVKSLFNAISGGIDQAREAFPGLFEYIDAIGDSFSSMADIVTGVWDGITKVIMGGISLVSGAINSVKSFLGFGEDVKVTGLNQSQINAAVNVNNIATGTPLNALNSAAISNTRTSNNSSNVTVGKVEIKTQATDSAGISRSIGNHLTDQLKRATSNYDDGLQA